MKKTILVVILVCIALLAGSIGGFLVVASKELSKMDVTDLDFSQLSDGSYRGEHRYMGFTCTVEVTVNDHRISRITVSEGRRDKYVDKAKMVTQRVIDAQSLNVDAVTGATFSSKAILKAVENALKKQK